MSSDQKVLLQKAILEIRDLKSRLKRVQDQYVEPIAIIGASCRFPGGANSLDSFWKLLESGYDGISDVPAERWDGDAYYHPDPDEPGKICTKSGGFLDVSAFDFDPHFFSISPREAESLDPQQRLLLELCLEAIEHANILPESMFKSNTGVFMGISSLDNATRIIGEAPSTDIDGYYGTGIALAPAAGRISYLFGFTGPSFVVDTACSSSLLSLHLACESLRRKECDLALGGGVQLLTHPGVSVAFTKARMLSVDGRCRTFDADANGYVRGEGGGVVLLKRLSDAQRDNDEILAVIRGSGVNQDGASGGLTVPSGPSQEAVIKTALNMAGLTAADVGYVEAHGTGTPLGDPIEIGALNSAYGSGHSPENPLFVGSLKTNIGHLEAGAGIASAIKVMLSLKNRKIAPHLNFRTPNPMIPWKQVPVQVPTSAMDWKLMGEQRVRSAGISSFGFSGTNVHLIMSEAPERATPETSASSSELQSARLLVLSAKSKKSLQLLSQKHAEALLSCEDSDWEAYTNTAATCRTPFPYRLAVAAESPATAASLLKSWVENGHHASVVAGKTDEGSQGQVLMLFSGQGAQYAGMGKQLFDESASFREDMQLCDRLMQTVLGYSILDHIFEGGDELNQTVNTQPALFALEVSLARLWKRHGGQVHGVIGHSIGEYAAAVIAGVLTLEDAAVLVAHRGKLMQSLPPNGSMMAVFTGFEELQQFLKSSGLDLSIATSNSPTNQVLSGLKSEIEKAKELLSKSGIETRPLSVSHAFHSSLMDPILEEFRKVVDSATFHRPEIPFYTNLTGQQAPELVSSTDYWVRQIRESVLFHKGVVNAIADGYDTIIEAGPKSTLINLVKSISQELGTTSENAAWEPMLSTSTPDTTQFLKALGASWCKGGPINSETFGNGRKNIPTYAFDRAFYKKEVELDVAAGNVSKTRSASMFGHALIDDVVDSPVLDAVLFTSTYSVEAHNVLRDHKVFGRYVVAGAAHLSLVAGASQHFWRQEAITLHDVLFPSALVLPDHGYVAVHVSISRNDAENPFRLVSIGADSQPVTHAVGGTSKPERLTGESIWKQSKSRATESIAPSEIYETQRKRHIVVGETYHWIQNVWRGTDIAVAELNAPEGISAEKFSIHPGMLDSCFGVLVMTAAIEVNETFIPFGVKSVTLYRSIGNESIRVIAQKQKIDAENGILVGDIVIESASGEVLARFEGMEGRKASTGALLKTVGSTADSLIFRKKWIEIPEPAKVTHDSKTMIVVSSTVSDATIERLRRFKSAQIVVIGSMDSGTGSGRNVDIALDSAAETDTFWMGLKQLPDQILFCLDGEHEVLPGNSDITIGIDLVSEVSLMTRFIQSLVRNRVMVPLSMMAITRESGNNEVVVPTGFAAAEALLKSVRREFTELRGSQILIGESVTKTSGWSDRVASLLGSVESVRIGVNGIQVARIHSVGSTSDLKPYSFASGSYLVTGGSGALAGHLADYLLDKGAGHIILVSRRFDDAQVERFSKLASASSARIDLVRSDVTDQKVLEKALNNAGIDPKSIKGVFHLAGTTADVAFNRLTSTEFERTFAPKLQGLVSLAKVTKAADLDFVITYSSIAAEFGNAGQEAYAAANAAMDAWAARAFGQKCMVKSILWGLWKDLGMASKLDQKQLAAVSKRGIGLIDAVQANGVLDVVISMEAGVVIAGDFDWNTDFFDTPDVSELRSVTETAPQSRSFVEELNDVPVSGRKRYVTGLLNTLLVSALRLPATHNIDPRERLFDLGVDSLIAIELKNKLQKTIGKQVSSTLLFDYPTLEKLTDHVLSLVVVEKLVQTEENTSKNSVSDEIDIDSMSDEDAEMALLRALSGLQGEENG